MSPLVPVRDTAWPVESSRTFENMPVESLPTSGFIAAFASTNAAVANLHKWKGKAHVMLPGGEGSVKRAYRFPRPDTLNGEFHVYAMDWDENRIVLSVDGVAVNDSAIDKVKNARFRSVENPFHQPHYLLVNLALGGDSGGDVTKVPFPVRMYVDYVRVYQKAGQN